MTDIKFDSQQFLGLGIHYQSQSWNYKQCLELLDEYVSPEIESLVQLAGDLGATPETKILHTYQGKDKNTYFNLPSVQRNKDDEFCLLVGDLQVPLTYESKFYKTGTYNFKVVVRRKDPKDNKSSITGINMVSEISTEVDGLEETANLIIPVRCKKDSDLAAIAKSLQSGNTDHDGISQIGVGGVFKPSYKPYMLPKGFYKIESVADPFFFNTGGKAWKGTVKALSDGEIYYVGMNTAPFIIQQRETLLIAAKNGAAVYLYIAGAYETSKGVGAIAHACRLTEIDGEVDPKMWSTFVADAKRITAATATKNSKDLLSEDQIAELKAKFEATENARYDEWAIKKASNQTSDTSNQTTDTQPVVPDVDTAMDEAIPF